MTVLAAAVLASALGAVYVRHESRVRFVALQQLQAERDRLNEYWGRLLLEQATWAGHGRIEAIARKRLGMTLPPLEHTVIVRTKVDEDE